MKNGVINLSVTELNRQLPTLHARFASSFSLKMTSVPKDVDGVFVRVFKAIDTDGYFDIPANIDANGDWECYIIGTTFPELGTAVYEVHAVDEQGNPTALGAGKVTIDAFSAGSTPITQGSEVSVATLPDETGALHQVVAVNLGTAGEPDWTWRVKTVNGEN